MTVEEALIYLPVDDANDAQDLYEEHLFELKQFFLNRFPVTKLINSRLTKFKKIEEAYIALGGQRATFSQVTSKEYPIFDSMHSLYSWYNVEKNTIRLQLSSANSHDEVAFILNNYIELTRFYASFWQVKVEERDKSIIKIGVEPNPMDLQEAMNALSDHQTLDAEYIFSLPEDNCLKSEAKRLSLWLNFEMNE